MIRSGFPPIGAKSNHHLNGVAGKRNAEVSRITRGLKLLAKKFKLPVLLLCQLNRDLEKRKAGERRPQLSDFGMASIIIDRL